MSTLHLSCATAIFVVDCCQFGPSWIFGLKMELMACAGLVDGTTDQRFIFPDLIWYYQWYETLLKLSASHLSGATAIFVVDCCQFCPSWIFGLKMELMACAYLVGGTTDKISMFPEIIWYHQWYEILPKCLHYTSAVPQPYLLLIAAKLAQAGFLGWKWSLWPVPTWLAVQRNKSVFFLTLYDFINDMKYFLNFCITPKPCHSHICCWLLPNWP